PWARRTAAGERRTAENEVNVHYSPLQRAVLDVHRARRCRPQPLPACSENHPAMGDSKRRSLRAMTTGAIAHVTRPAAGEVAGALILFHGRGTSEHDLVPLLDMLDPEQRLVGVTPRGPLSLPPGGAHWYAVARIGFPDHDTFHATYATAGGWLDSVLAGEGVPIERTVIGGFSQGA